MMASELAAVPEIHAFSREPVARERSVPAAAARIGTGPAEVDSFERPDQAARVFDQTRRDLPLPTAGAGNEHGASRGKSNAMFVNLSRRSQALVERQLRLIESLEHGEQDRQRLASLSRLNRIAMRMHRNSQNLLVLAGQEPATSWNQPVTLAHLVEAALSEVEDYQRVSFEVQPDIAVRGPAVHDAVHLLVELIDNATSFSAADMPVHIRGHVLTTGGALVDVTDRGIGMAANEMAYANQQLDNPPPPDIDVPKWMGLLVVARLAARHGIRVRLNQADLGGLTALVWLPDEILTHYSAAADPGHPAAAPRARDGQSPAFVPARVDQPAAQPGPAWSARGPQATVQAEPAAARLSGAGRPDAPGGDLGVVVPQAESQADHAPAAHLRRGRVTLVAEHPRGVRSGRPGRRRASPPPGAGGLPRRPPAGTQAFSHRSGPAPWRRAVPRRVPRAATRRPDSRAAPARGGPRPPKRRILADQTSPDAGDPAARPGVVTRPAPFGFSRVVFLSHVIDAGTPVFPGDPPVEIRPAAVIQQDGYYLQSLTLGEQAGTHWAAPAHFHVGQPFADELDPGDFFRPAVVLDVRAAAGRDPDFALGVPADQAVGGDLRPDPAGQRRHHVDRLRGPVGRPGRLPERGLRRSAALSGLRRRGRALADRPALHRRPRDRHDGDRPRHRRLFRCQPVAPSRASPASGKPVRAEPDAADGRLDHHRGTRGSGPAPAPRRRCSG